MNVEGKITSGRSLRQWQAHFHSQVRQGRPARDLLADMILAGYSPDEARAMADRAVRAYRSTLGKVLGCSTLLLLGGILFTCSTYSTARASGSATPYFIWIGGVLCGLIGIVYSVVRMSRLR